MITGNREAEEGRKGMKSGLEDAGTMIEAWIRVSMTEMPVSPAEERIIVASAELALKGLRKPDYGNNAA